MGSALSGVAGVLHVGVGRLQKAIGLAPSMASSYLLMVPAALLALHVLSKNRALLADSQDAKVTGYAPCCGPIAPESYRRFVASKRQGG